MKQAWIDSYLPPPVGLQAQDIRGGITVFVSKKVYRFACFFVCYSIVHEDHVHFFSRMDKFFLVGDIFFCNTSFCCFWRGSFLPFPPTSAFFFFFLFLWICDVCTRRNSRLIFFFFLSQSRGKGKLLLMMTYWWDKNVLLSWSLNMYEDDWSVSWAHS